MPLRVSRAEAVARAGDIAARAVPPVFIGIDGRGGAGKTSLATSIESAVAGVAVVHVDDFAAPHIAEWDWERLQRQVADPLLAGRPAHYQRWDWDRNEGAEWHDVPPDRTVVIEGVSSTRSELAVPWALTIWVDAPRAVRLRRALARDGEEMLGRWLSDWMPSEEAYVARERPQQRVDLVVAGTE
jgi:uridine kinase